MAPNIRRSICRHQKRGSWLFKACDCQRYEKTVNICKKTGLLPNDFCFAEDRVFYFEPVPQVKCESCPGVPVNICFKSGKVAGIYCDWHVEFFREDLVPTDLCQVCRGELVEVCQKTFLLPGEYCYTFINAYKPDQKPTRKCQSCLGVTIDVCEKTGWLPGKYCKTVERTFREDKLPTATCIACTCEEKHVLTCSVSGGLWGPNCRIGVGKMLCEENYPPACSTCFPDIQYRGYLTYGMLDLFGDLKFIYPKEDGSWFFDEKAFRDHLAPIIGAGADSVRAFGWSVFSPEPLIPPKKQFQAFQMADAATWDLDVFNNYYFPICRRAIEITNSLGAAFLFDWIDQCQIQQGFWRYLSPWCHNIQGGYDFYDSRIWPQVKRFMLRCVDEFKGLNVIWGFNETDWDAFVGFATGVYFEVIQERNLDFIKLRNGSGAKMPAYDQATDKYAWTIDTQHWVRYWAEKRFGEYGVLCWLREVHGAWKLDRPGIVDAFLEAWGNHPIRLALSDDGQNPRPNASEWYDISKLAFSYRSDGSWEGKPIRRCINLEHCGEGEDVPTLVAIFRAMKRGMDQL